MSSKNIKKNHIKKKFINYSYNNNYDNYDYSNYYNNNNYNMTYNKPRRGGRKNFKNSNTI